MKQKRHWVFLLWEKLMRLQFPALTQGEDKFTPGKRLAGWIAITQEDAHTFKNVEEVAKILWAEVWRQLDKAIRDGDRAFIGDYRRARNAKGQHPLREVYLWMLGNHEEIDGEPSAGAILKRIKKQFPKHAFDDRRMYRLFAELGLPLTKPRTNRTP